MKQLVKSATLRYVLFAIGVVYIFVMFIKYIEYDDRLTPSMHVDNRIIYILLWNKFFHNYDYIFGTNGKQFAGDNACPVDNCVVTYNRSIRPINKYDSIVFHAWDFNINDIPLSRNPSQYYTYVSLESPNTFKVSSTFDNFFNWSVSYRFDSDFFWPYYKLKDNSGVVVSPSLQPNWDKYIWAIHNTNRSLVATFDKKKKKAAWFVSHCESGNSRDKYVKELQKFIEIDIYGRCGSLKCPKKNEIKCLNMVKNDYFFYIAFENSHCIDYMTEKAYIGLLYDTIPVLFGRAKYSNFIPPHSFLDANEYDPQELASIMNGLAKNPDEYVKYFWWKGLFTFHNLGNEYILAEPNLHPFCEMCKALNKPDLNRKTYKNFVSWWETLPNSSEPACIRPNINKY